jgi:hypothetical protein
MKLRRVLIAAAFGIGSTAGMAAALAPAHAMGCPDPDNPCDPTPITVPKPTKPTVTFGCGTVTVTEGGTSKTLHILPCPGPAI